MNTKPRNTVALALLILLGVAMVATAWWIIRADADKRNLAEQERIKAQGRIKVQREWFFASEVPALLEAEEQRNQEAIARARDLLSSKFAHYKNGVPAFAGDLTTWGSRYQIAKAALNDWWNKSNETRKYATDRFANFVVSDEQLQKDITSVLEQFSSDLKANRNRMLADLQERISSASVPCASADQGSTNLAAAFMVRLQDAATVRAKQSDLIAALSFGGGFIATEATAQIVARIIATMTARVAAGAATTGSTVAADVLVGGAGGTVLEPGVGTAIGIVGGIIVGCAVDWWMEKNFKQKVTTECNQMLAEMEKDLWSNGSEGLESKLKEAVTVSRACHETALRQIIIGG